MKPATELAKEANSHQRYIVKNLKDPIQLDAFNKSSLYRARRVALTLGGVLVVTLILVVFAFVQDVQYKAATKKKSDLEAQLNLCVQEAQKQQAIAAENMLILEEANKLAAEKLRACQSKK